VGIKVGYKSRREAGPVHPITIRSRSNENTLKKTAVSHPMKIGRHLLNPKAKMRLLANMSSLFDRGLAFFNASGIQ
jgi:hypothetical protein